MKDEKERLIDAIEILNKEKKQILNSKEYQLGNNILKTIYHLKHFQFNAIRKKIISKHKNKVDKKTLYQFEPRENGNFDKEERIKNKKIVVYTCITGNYDNIVEPLCHDENLEYIVYSNSQNLELKEWKKRDIPQNIKKLNDNVLINRYIKMHPAELFKDYDYAIYIDGNIRVISDISCFINRINKRTGLAIHRHYVRNCVYLEAKACELYKKGNLKNLKNQIEQYKIEKFPEKYGLLECNVIVSDLKNENSEKILNEWWNDFYKYKGMRDQISLPYVLWKFGYQTNEIGNLGYNVRKNEKIEIVKHNKK